MFRIVSAFLVAELQGGYVISALDPLNWEALEERFGAFTRRRGGGRRSGVRGRAASRAPGTLSHDPAHR